MKHRDIPEKIIIGWREYVDLPEWGIHNIRTKIDTGARTSSLHVDQVKHLENGSIKFSVVVSEKGPVRRKWVVARIIKKGKVKSSTGHKTHRWYVKTRLKIGQYDHEITLNLTDRVGMNFRMLLGRTAIEDIFLVDVDRSFLISQKNNKES